MFRIKSQGTKRHGVVLTALGVTGALAFSSLALVPAEAASDITTVKGHVRSAEGKPVANVVASLYYKSPSVGEYLVKRVHTSKTGRYEVKVPTSFGGGYKLRVNDPGDNDRDQADGRWAATIQQFNYTGKSTVRDVTVKPGAKLSGRIYDRTGKPVKAGLRIYAQGKTQVGNPFTYTRKDGAYYFSNLNAGATTVLVYSPTTNGSYRFYQRTNSAGTLDGTKATPLQLKANAKTTGISLYFPAVSKITGRVTVNGSEPFGENQEYVSTVLYDESGKRVVEGYFTNPTFYFRDLPAGTYYLGFESNGVTPEFYADAETLATATPITVKSGGAVTGLVANLTRPVEPTPSASPSATATPAPSASPTATPTPTVTPSASPSATSVN